MTTLNHIGLAFFGGLLAVCIYTCWHTRKRPNRRVRLPAPFRDTRDSITAFREMYK